MRKVFGLSGVLLLSCLLFANVSFSAEIMKAAGGQMGGGWYTIVSGLAEIINSEMKDDLSLAVVPGAGVSNVATCSMGTTPITMSFPPFIVAANKGIDPYKQKFPKTRIIATNFGVSAQHLVTTRSNLATYSDIGEKKLPLKLALNKPGATDEFIWRKVMDYYGISYDSIKDAGGKIFHVGHGEGIELSKDGHVDTVFAYISVPAASITEMSLAQDLTYVDLPAEAQQSLMKEWSLLPYTIPAGTYKGQDKDITSLAMANTLMVNADISDDLVYKITKTLCENADRVRSVHKAAAAWTPESAGKGVESLLHPGAARYYKEMGYIK